MCKGRVLVVDDLPDVRVTLSGLLSDEGYDVRSASSRAEALQLLGTERFHVAVLDVRLDESDIDNQDGLLLMHQVRKTYPATAIIVLTAYANVKMVQEALQPRRDGDSPAFAFLEKSEVDQLPEYVERALKQAIPAIGDLIAQGENEHVEFKSSARWDFKKGAVNKDLLVIIAKTIAGMLNSNGGTLLIGVADDGTVLGIEKDLQTLRKPSTDDFQLMLTNVVQSYLGSEYLRHVHIHFGLVDDKQVCVVSIEASPQPAFLTVDGASEFWMRTGNSTRSLDVKAAMNYVQAHWRKAE